MARKAAKLSDQIRRAIEQCGLTRYAIAKRTGIPESTLSRFVAGRTGIAMKHLDKLAELLGITITIDMPKTARELASGTTKGERPVKKGGRTRSTKRGVGGEKKGR